MTTDKQPFLGGRKKGQTGTIDKSKGYDPTSQLTQQEKAFVCLSLFPTWNSTTAYRAVFSDYASKDEYCKKSAYIKNQKEGIKVYRYKMAEVLTGLKGNLSIFPTGNNIPASAVDVGDSVEHTVDNLDAMVADEKYSKDFILKELAAMYEASTDTADRLKILKAISDLENMKREASTNTDQQTVFFLPLRCKSGCSLYAKAVEDGIVDPDE